MLRELGQTFLILAFMIALHQFLLIGSWFEVRDIHHELFVAMFGFSGLVLFMLASHWRRRREIE